MSILNKLLQGVPSILADIRTTVNAKAEELELHNYSPLQDGDFKEITNAIDKLNSPLALEFQSIGLSGIPKALIDNIAMSENLVVEWSENGWSIDAPFIYTEDDKSKIRSSNHINMPYLPQVYVGVGLDTSNLFKGCSRAFSAKDIKVVKSGESLFEGCANLRSIRSIKVKKEEGEEDITSLKNMFKGCTILQSIPNIANWKVDNVTSLSGTFSNCKNLQSLEIGEWKVSNVEDFSSCFKGCVLKDHLNLSSWNVASATNVASMFESCTCSSLTIGDWDLSKVTDASRMFWWCTLKKVDLTTVIWNENVNLSNFLNYSSLTSLVGNRTLEDVGERGSDDCIKLFKGVKSNIDLQTIYTSIDAATLQAVYNGIADATNIKEEDEKPKLIVKTGNFTLPSENFEQKITDLGWIWASVD